MRKRFRIFIVLASTFAMVAVLGVGTAFASNSPATDWDCTDYNQDVGADNLACSDSEVDIVNSGGTAVKPQTLAPILTLPSGNGQDNGQFRGIDNNPFCLLHDSDTAA